MDRDLGGIRCRLDEESVVDVGERSAAARAAAASRPSLEKSRTGEKVVIDWVSWHVGRSVLLLCTSSERQITIYSNLCQWNTSSITSAAVYQDDFLDR